MNAGDAQTTLKPLWTSVDQFFVDRLAPADRVLEGVLEANRAAGLPAIDVSPRQGRTLTVLTMATGARRVLEIGTLGGYSTICLARGLAGHPGAKVVTIEAVELHARTATANFARAGVADVIDLHLGPAAETLDRLIAARAEPFDLIFIDADKSGYPGYLAQCLKLARSGTLLIADNVVRGGDVLDAASTDPNVQGVRAFTDQLARQGQLVSTTIQTVGAKGYDGFVLAVVHPTAQTPL